MLRAWSLTGTLRLSSDLDFDSTIAPRVYHRSILASIASHETASPMNLRWPPGFRARAMERYNRWSSQGQAKVHWVYSSELRFVTVLHKVADEYQRIPFHAQPRWLCAGIDFHSAFNTRSSFENNFVPTIIWQLAGGLPALRGCVVEYVGLTRLHNSRADLWMLPGKQVEELLIEPYLRAADPRLSILILLDNLNACSDQAMGCVLDFMERTLRSRLPVRFAIGSTGDYHRCARLLRQSSFWNELEKNQVDDEQQSAAALGSESSWGRPESGPNNPAQYQSHPIHAQHRQPTSDHRRREGTQPSYVGGMPWQEMQQNPSSMSAAPHNVHPDYARGGAYPSATRPRHPLPDSHYVRSQASSASARQGTEFGTFQAFTTTNEQYASPDDGWAQVDGGSNSSPRRAFYQMPGMTSEETVGRNTPTGPPASTSPSEQGHVRRGATRFGDGSVDGRRPPVDTHRTSINAPLADAQGANSEGTGYFHGASGVKVGAFNQATYNLNIHNHNYTNSPGQPPPHPSQALEPFHTVVGRPYYDN